MKETSRLFTLLVCSLMCGLPAQAGQCGYEDCWGAIGFNGNGRIGLSYSHWSEARAYEAAQDRCDWSCAEMRTFKNACAAIVEGKNGAWIWAKGATRGDAETTAHQICDDRSHACKTVVWACSH